MHVNIRSNAAACLVCYIYLNNKKSYCFMVNVSYVFRIMFMYKHIDSIYSIFMRIRDNVCFNEPLMTATLYV